MPQGRRGAGRAVKYVWPVIMTLLTYLPIVMVVIYSFNESKLYSVWGGFSFKWYEALFNDDDMFAALVNSLVLGAVSSVLAAVIATSAALAYDRAKLPFKWAAEKISILPIIIPEIILGMVLLAFFSLLGIPAGMITLVIAHTSFCIPYIYTEVRARLQDMDMSPSEAARDLGASGIRAFMTVTLPMIAPAIAAGMFMSFAMSFDDVIISVFVTGVSVNTLPIIVYTSMKTGVTPEVNALCTLMLAVTLLLYGAALIIKHAAAVRTGSGRTQRKEPS